LTVEDARARLEAMAEPADGTIAVEVAEPQPGGWTHARPEIGPLEAARFRHTIDHAWRRTSYSALTAGTALVGQMKTSYFCMIGPKV
jgi:exodeoxyribonuclease V beta subunit